MRRDALFCDGTSSYVMPAEPKAGETVTLRFRTAENDVADVILLVGEEKARYTMQKADSIENFDFWEIQWTLDEDPLVYCFEIQRGGEICYYNRCGVSDRIVDYYDFKIVPGFSTPDWAKGAVMYQIFVDRFIMAIRKMMWKTGNIFISEHHVSRSKIGALYRQHQISAGSTAETCRELWIN